MSEDNGDLKALETLLNEFFAVGTCAARQREIEEILHGFGSQRGAWSHCLGFLSRTSNQYVSMFCLTTIETVINRQWQGLPWEERVQLKSLLNNFAIQHHRSMPPFLRNKLVKLVVDIARHDWPHFYPDFLTNIIQMIQSPEHAVLGLVFALTASEELVSPREDLSSARREELRRLLLAQVPQLFTSLTGVLESLLERQKRKATSTPPPSPTHGQPESNSVASATHSGSLLSGMLERLGAGQSPTCLDEEAQSRCSLALQALTHYLSWVPLASYLTPHLIKVLFQYAAMPQHALVCGEVSGPSLGVQAMGAVNELLYKQCVPAEWHDLLLDMFGSAFTLLQRLLTDGLETVEETYLEKLSEFLRLFVGFHLHRFEGNERFPLSEFLSLLFRFTFQQPGLDNQLVCLELWCQLASYLVVRVQDRAVHREQILDLYREALVSLAAQLLQSMQFRHNQAQLEELDDETMDDDDQTEWQHFLCQNIETIAKIAELLPLQIYPMVLDAWESASAEYARMFSSGRVASLQEHENSRLHCVLRDLSSLSQALGRLSAGLEDETIAATAVAQRLVEVAAFGARTRLYLAPAHCGVGVLQPDLLAVHAQVLAALKAWSPWLGSKTEARQLAFESVRTAVSSLGPPEPPPLVAHAAAHLLLSLTAALRCPELSNMPEMQELMRQAPALPGLPDEARRLILRSLANSLLLPWVGHSEQQQQWLQRQQMYSAFVSALASDLQGLLPPAGQNLTLSDLRETGPRLVCCLRLLVDQVETLGEESPATKRVVAAALSPALQQCLDIFPVYSTHPEACEALLQLFLAVFGSLQQQLGAQFAERMAQLFLEVFTNERLTQAVIQQEAGQGPAVLDKFLKILQLMIQEPGQAFKRFVPSTITLCMDHIFPLVSQRQCPDVKLALLELLTQILMYNWRLFFRSGGLGMRHALLGKENSAPGEEGEPPVQHKDQLLRILRVFGNCLLQNDPATFRLSLESLEKINSKHKLYHKAVFREELLAHFLTVLLGVLVERSQALLQDEIVGALHSMASVELETFHNRFLPSFLTTTPGLDNSQRMNLASNFKMETDLPSFSQGLLRLINDLRCYRLCNASLPAGSIQL